MSELVGGGPTAALRLGALASGPGVDERAEAGRLGDELLESVRRLVRGVRRRHRVRVGELVRTVCRVARSPGLTRRLFLRVFDPYDPERFLEHHAVNVMALALQLGRSLPLVEDDRVRLALAAVGHDLGMYALPEDLVRKPAPYTRAERDALHTHPERGARLLLDLGERAREVARVVLQEHEREDGTGYPGGVGGDRIALAAKIIAAADTFEALVHSRPHRRGIPPHRAVRRMAKDLQASFSPDVLRALIRQVTPFPPGTGVRLSDGRCGRVIAVDPDTPLRPTVRTEEAGGPGEEIDLGSRPILHIRNVIERDEV